MSSEILGLAYRIAVAASDNNNGQAQLLLLELSSLVKDIGVHEAVVLQLKLQFERKLAALLDCRANRSAEKEGGAAKNMEAAKEEAHGSKGANVADCASTLVGKLGLAFGANFEQEKKLLLAAQQELMAKHNDNPRLRSKDRRPKTGVKPANFPWLVGKCDPLVIREEWAFALRKQRKKARLGSIRAKLYSKESQGSARSSPFGATLEAQVAPLRRQPLPFPERATSSSSESDQGGAKAIMRCNFEPANVWIPNIEWVSAECTEAPRAFQTVWESTQSPQPQDMSEWAKAAKKQKSAARAVPLSISDAAAERHRASASRKMSSSKALSPGRNKTTHE